MGCYLPFGVILGLYPPTLAGVLDGCRRRTYRKGGRGGLGGYPGFVSLQVPTSEAAVSADTLGQAPTRRFAQNRNLRWGKGQASGGPGPKPWGPSLDPATLASRVLRLKPMGPGLKTLGCYHNPQSKAELYSVMRGGFPSSLQHFSRWAGPQALGTWPTSP